ncbi:hypothetical protein SH668x_000285 [Planctomicrobium sp. SH668]|uniref:hypothetical protein n=1 Tax=Planctomicrobium sp. SH668 TaxID=3448126 RepID=UPI003F5BF380
MARFGQGLVAVDLLSLHEEVWTLVTLLGIVPAAGTEDKFERNVKNSVNRLIVMIPEEPQLASLSFLTRQHLDKVKETLIQCPDDMLNTLSELAELLLKDAAREPSTRSEAVSRLQPETDWKNARGNQEAARAWLDKYIPSPDTLASNSSDEVRPSAESGSPSKRKRKEAGKQVTDALFVSALLHHHQYHDGGCQNYTPISVRQLAGTLAISPATITRRFQKYFPGKGDEAGYDVYKRHCCSKNLAIVLKHLENPGEFSRILANQNQYADSQNSDDE